VKLFYRLLKNNIQIHSSSYARGERVSSYVKYIIGESKLFGNIQVFVKLYCNCVQNCSCTTLYLAIIRRLSVQPFQVDALIISHLVNVSIQEHAYDVVLVEDLETILFKVGCEGRTTLAEPLNKFELE